MEFTQWKKKSRTRVDHAEDLTAAVGSCILPFLPRFFERADDIYNYPHVLSGCLYRARKLSLKIIKFLMSKQLFEMSHRLLYTYFPPGGGFWEMNKYGWLVGVCEWVSVWVSVWVSEWVSYWVSEWVSGWVSEWINEWVVGWVSEWVNE